ncbi:MAG: hypothetical protein GXP27_13400, partial [Planctomycetes bacterium]|nr:hypothetical protein [Planctomycetota bacterium]
MKSTRNVSRVVNVAVAALSLWALQGNVTAGDVELLGHWTLSNDARDVSGHGLHGHNHHVSFGAGGAGDQPARAGVFDGRSSYIEVPHNHLMQIGTDDFSISLWVHTEETLDDVLGDLVSQYDPQTRTGFVLSIKHNVGGTTSQANYRHVEFGIDNGKVEQPWTDCGRLGNAVLVYSLAVYDGALFAGTCVPGRDEAGRVFRYAGDKRWIDCGAPDRCNAVSALAVYNGKLYAAVSKYRLRGSSLSESENPHTGGRVYRYEGGRRWTHVGTLPRVEAINGMVVYRGKLYASSMYAPAGLFRFEGGKHWTDCGSPGGKRVEALCVFNGELFATGYDEGAVYRYDGREWRHAGRLGDNTQTYSFAVHYGRLYVGTWRSGRVYRWAGGNRWEDMGRLGQELEVMGMAVYNGKLYAGTLPLAEVYRFDEPGRWSQTGRVDFTPDVRYRRAWTMAVFDGKLVVGTLPSGRVWSFEA